MFGIFGGSEKRGFYSDSIYVDWDDSDNRDENYFFREAKQFGLNPTDLS